MKIVHIITRLILGGAQENTIITCDLLKRHGHDVVLVTGPALGPEGQLFDKAQHQGYETIVVDDLCREIAPLADWRAYRQLIKLLTELNPDIVHTHSAKAGILGRFAAHKIRPRSKIVHTVHGLAFHPYLSSARNRFYIAVEKAAARKTDAFICVADAMTQKMLAAGIGRNGQFTTAYSAIEERDFLTAPGTEQVAEFRRKYDIDAKSVVLVCIARLAELKGHEYIIESARRLACQFKDCIWLFVGDGNLADQIRLQIRSAGLDCRFRFTGLLPPEQIPLAVHSSDILVHCSLREGLARVLPQAMLCAKPVISFDIDGAREVVNEATGRLLEPENVDALTGACAELIADSGLRVRLGLAGRESVTEKFAPDTMVETIESVYERLLRA